jgi:hypothetical protein
VLAAAGRERPLRIDFGPDGFRVMDEKQPHVYELGSSASVSSNSFA